jgi:NAD(P)-dependent dehydrogenase (short-subunit alcohol dehydrogenase family)
MHELKGKTVLITGVSGAVGGRVATTLSGYGARVIGTYRTGEDAARAAVGTGDILRADFGGPGAARDLWRDASAIAEIDTVVVNAAVIEQTPLTGDDDAWDAGWENTLRVNVIAASTLMREAAAAFAARGSGSIIVISSWAGQQGSRIPELSAYAASKAAIRNVGQSLARAYARDGVLIYTIAPGVVDAGMGTAGMSDDAIRAVADGLTMGRHVEVREIAELAAFLATGRAPSLTGSTLDLNGASYLR